MEWTRGKNLIISSAASSVLGLRGPNDVSNLSSLLGLSNEHAKAAISKNCRYVSSLKRQLFPPNCAIGVRCFVLELIIPFCWFGFCCRLLLANALRKRQFYKEAIRVEVMPAGAQIGPNEPWVVDDVDWDPISTGEGDVCLDDMAKSFANSGKVSQTVKAIDFAPIVNLSLIHI